MINFVLHILCYFSGKTRARLFESRLPLSQDLKLTKDPLNFLYFLYFNLCGLRKLQLKTKKPTIYTENLTEKIQLRITLIGLLLNNPTKVNYTITVE